MSEQYDALYCRIHDYMTSELEGAATTRQRRDFAELLLHSESARQIYVAYTQEQTSLRWSYANQPFDLFDQAMHEALSSNAATTELSARTTDRILSRAIAAVLTAAVVLAGVSTWLNFGQSRFRGWIGDGGAASSVAVADEATGDAVGSHSDPPARTAVATVTRVIDVKWAAGATPPAELSRLRPGQTLDLLTGRVELLFDTGVELILEGQTHFKVLSSGSGFSQHGSIAARVGEEARGFTIETPSARVIDLGTEFGVTISESGETEVAVFRGIVDLTLDGADHTSDQSITKRLNQGEALRVGNNGQFHRVFAVASDRFPSSSPDHLSKRGRPALISDVRDNMRDPESRKFYKIVRSGLHEDAPAFVDRNHQWNGVDERGIPPQLLGAEYVMPFNDDKQFSSRLEVTLFVARPITLYIFLSDAVSTPEWLLRGEFVDTGEDIGLDEGPSRWHPASTGRRKLAVGAGKGINTVFSIWKRDVPVPSQVVVGGVERPADINGFNMYGIAAVPMD